jgi:hypothetical protein
VSDAGTVIVGLAIAVGSATAFAVLAAATVLLAGAQVIKLLVPGRRLLIAGVPRRSILAAVAEIGD